MGRRRAVIRLPVALAAVVLLKACGDSDIPTATAAPNPDRAPLVALYNQTGGSNWTNDNNWLTDSALGIWYGVETDRSGRVIALRLVNNHLSGRIPPELATHLPE